MARRNEGYQMCQLRSVWAACIFAVCLAGIWPSTARAYESEQIRNFFAAQAESSEIANLRMAINSQDLDLILAELNNLKVTRNKAEILPYVQNLWSEQQEADTDLNWEIVQLPIVRVEIANILLQATKNGFIRSNVQEYREYVRRYVLDDDAMLARNSILTLSLANDERDVPLLMEAAQRENPTTFGAAVLSLSYMCSESAAAALDKLEEDSAGKEPEEYLSGETPQNYIRQTRASAEPVRDFYADDCK